MSMMTMVMRLHDRPFESFKTGKKRIELRLRDEKRAKLKVGDKLTFRSRSTNEELLFEVVGLHVAPTFEILVSRLDPIACGWFEGEQVDVSVMNTYYSPEDIITFGVVGIEVTPLS